MKYCGPLDVVSKVSGMLSPSVVKAIIRSGVDWIESDDPVRILRDVRTFCGTLLSPEDRIEDPRGDGEKRIAADVTDVTHK